ncbi:MAG TPA: hypothetical protein VFS47_12105 [Steroidobacteraceae bacterium]|jgi:hypothetical protein|nr:hypothetical protein [Steroidobacteraceae bacterium]
MLHLGSTRKCSIGNATAETLIALLALAPFIAGIPLLGKQLDIKQKSYDATRYAVWERTIWSPTGTHAKSAEEIELEARDRTLGDPNVGIASSEILQTQGITQNNLWRDTERKPLLDYDHTPVAYQEDERPTPVEVGRYLVPSIAYGDGTLADVARALKVRDLNLNRHAFSEVQGTLTLRAVLDQRAERHRDLSRSSEAQEHAPLVQRTGGAILSDTWAVSDENNFRKRIDDLALDEMLENLELPGRLIGMQAQGKGKPLYGEGQFGWDPDLRPRTITLPSAYLRQE